MYDDVPKVMEQELVWSPVTFAAVQRPVGCLCESRLSVCMVGSNQTLPVTIICSVCITFCGVLRSRDAELKNVKWPQNFGNGTSHPSGTIYQVPRRRSKLEQAHN